MANSILTKKCRLVDTGIATAAANMALDAKLLESMAENTSQETILHFYDWERLSATFGYFINPYTLLNREAVATFGLQLARRPTGGGIIFHLSDFAFSIVVPAAHPGYSINVLDNYAFVNHLVEEVIRRFIGKKSEISLLQTEPLAINANARHFCMAKPTKYDVMLDGRKVGGGAQRRTRHGFLHQGSISLALPDENFLKQVLLDTSVLEAMRQQTFALLPGKPSLQEILEARNALRDIFSVVVLESHA